MLLVLSVFSSAIFADSNSADRRDAAKSQFERAEKERQDLESRPESARSLKEYNSVVSSYKRVALITAHSAEVPEALNEIAALYCAMGDLFDVKYYQAAIDAYDNLLKQYPTSQYRESALLATAAIQQNDLHDSASAQKSYQDFLSAHPRSAHAAEVRASLAKLADNDAEKTSAAPSPTRPDSSRLTAKPLVADPKMAAAVQDADSSPANSKELSIGAERSGYSSIPQLSRIRTWNADTYTRIVIDVGAKVKYQAARITNPDRIYFDIENTKINSALLHKSIEVADGGLLKGVRIAQNQSDVVRVVLEVDHVKDYSVFLLPDPYRLIVDIYGNRAPAIETAGTAGASSAAHNSGTETAAQNSEEKNAASKTKIRGKNDSKAVAELMSHPMYPSRLPGVEPSEKPPTVASAGDESP
ncbi:MAG: AMIN domain-containing protein, partial [Bryobacteraceae bacterium]